MGIKKKLAGWHIKTKKICKRILAVHDNAGMGVIEVILIIVVLIGLVVIFRNNITNIVNSLFNKITSKINTF